MASKQAMLPWLGHSVVVMTNTNESPARFAIVLQLLDFMTGHAPPTPSWTATYLGALAAQVNATRRADAAARARYAAARARPGGDVAPGDSALLGWYAHPESRWCRSLVLPAFLSFAHNGICVCSLLFRRYAHPAYGNCSVSVDKGVVGAASLRLGHCATLLPGSNAAPSIAASASLTHLYFSTFGLGVPRANFAMATASTQLIRFFATQVSQSLQMAHFLFLFLFLFSSVLFKDRSDCTASTSYRVFLIRSQLDALPTCS